MSPDQRELAKAFEQRMSSICRRLEMFKQVELAASSISAVRELEDLLSDSTFSSISQALMSQVALRRKAARIRRAYERYYFSRERTAALLVVRGRDGAEFLSNNYALATMELEAADIAASHHVYFLGSGPFPWSAIRYAAVTGCRVTCIDRNREAIAISRQLITKLGFDGLVQFLQGDAQEIDYRGSSHIVLAGMVRPKRAILRRVAATSPIDARVIVRSSHGLYLLMYEACPPRTMAGFEITSVVRPPSGELFSYVLTKKR